MEKCRREQTFLQSSSGCSTPPEIFVAFQAVCDKALTLMKSPGDLQDDQSHITIGTLLLCSWTWPFS
jgi:hypothetical protein